MIAWNVVFDGLSLDGYATVYGIEEVYREVEGTNVRTSISGEDIPDILAVKYDLIITCRPLTPQQMHQLHLKLAGNATSPYKTLSYTTLGNESGGGNYKMSITGGRPVMNNASRTLIDGVVITLQQK